MMKIFTGGLFLCYEKKKETYFKDNTNTAQIQPFRIYSYEGINTAPTIESYEEY